MAKIFNKILDYIGLEETPLDEEAQDQQIEDVVEEPVQEMQEPPAPVRSRKGKIVNMPSSNNMKMIVFQPMSYEDTQSVIDNLKNRKPVVVNLEALDLDVAQRVLDFMSGAVYAVNGTIQKVSRCIFVLAPNNVDVVGNIASEASSNSFIDLETGQDR
ncbi:MAG: cell division protein SepF [Christensenellales bacterium]|jgi:cell division inhibitor SepF|nr:cell division protein SepF [Clostridiales bacterium]